MNYQPIVDVVSKLAPAVAGAIAGPAGSIVVSAVESLFGVKATTPDELAKVVQADPEAQMKLLSLQYNHEEAILALQTKDTQDARKMNSDCKDWIVHFLAILYTIGFFSYLVALACHPEMDKSFLSYLVNCCTLILSFYFGSAYGMIKNK